MERLGIRFAVGKSGVEFSGKRIAGKARKPSEMKDVVYDPDGLAGWKYMYLMYRGINRHADKSVSKMFSANGVRYDITFIPSGFIGPEFNKTFGHFHPRSGRGRFYGEFYEILSGKALFLLQHRKLEDFIAIEGKKGEGIYIPGEYGHVTVNIGRRPLVLGNLVSDGFSSMYEPVRKKRGFAYYVFKDEIFVPNIRYKRHPTLVFAYAEKLGRLDKLFLGDPEAIRDVLLGK